MPFVNIQINGGNRKTNNNPNSIASIPVCDLRRRDDMGKLIVLLSWNGNSAYRSAAQDVS